MGAHREDLSPDFDPSFTRQLSHIGLFIKKDACPPPALVQEAFYSSLDRLRHLPKVEPFLRARQATLALEARESKLVGKLWGL